MEPMGSTRSAPPDDQNLAGSPDLEEQRETRMTAAIAAIPHQLPVQEAERAVDPDPAPRALVPGKGAHEGGEGAEPRTPATVAEVDARS